MLGGVGRSLISGRVLVPGNVCDEDQGLSDHTGHKRGRAQGSWGSTFTQGASVGEHSTQWLLRLERQGDGELPVPGQQWAGSSEHR